MASSCASPAPNSSERSNQPARSSLERDEQGIRRPRGIMKSQLLPLAKVRFLPVASASELCTSVPKDGRSFPVRRGAPRAPRFVRTRRFSAKWRNRSLRVTACSEGQRTRMNLRRYPNA
jgi:hypothetical protein